MTLEQTLLYHVKKLRLAEHKAEPCRVEYHAACIELVRAKMLVKEQQARKRKAGFALYTLNYT